MIISGPSSSGKSTFLLNLVAEYRELIDPTPASILYCFGEMSTIVPVLQKAGISVYAGVPPEELIRRQTKPLLLILDDLLMSIDEKYLSELFTKKSHHQNFAVVFVTQNLFERKIKVARQNAQYVVLMRSPNSVLAVRNLGVQLFPRQLDFFLDAYRQATSQPYGYLVIDMSASSDPVLRLRTGIFKEDEERVIFIPKNGGHPTRSAKKRTKMLRDANAEQLLSLVEICLNIVATRFTLTTRQKKRLMPYADFVRRMSRARSERGLTAASDTGDINLDAVRHELQRARSERANPSAKNVRYNQQLRRYLHMRKEHESKPTKVELSNGLSVLVKRGGEEEAEVVDIPQPPAQRQHRIPQTQRSGVNTPQPPAQDSLEAPPLHKEAARRFQQRISRKRAALKQPTRNEPERDLVAEAAAAPLPYDVDDDDYLLEDGSTLSVPSVNSDELILPDSDDDTWPMEGYNERRIATKRKAGANEDDDQPARKKKKPAPSRKRKLEAYLSGPKMRSRQEAHEVELFSIPPQDLTMDQQIERIYTISIVEFCAAIFDNP
uniref:AAA+ ATPase domain-containing protein n=1 Tax=Globodera rostochiensis TaxID=31243 RepID=A0A914IH82_GLORO